MEKPIQTENHQTEQPTQLENKVSARVRVNSSSSDSSLSEPEESTLSDAESFLSAPHSVDDEPKASAQPAIIAVEEITPPNKPTNPFVAIASDLSSRSMDTPEAFNQVKKIGALLEVIQKNIVEDNVNVENIRNAINDHIQKEQAEDPSLLSSSRTKLDEAILVIRDMNGRQLKADFEAFLVMLVTKFKANESKESDVYLLNHLIDSMHVKNPFFQMQEYLQAHQFDKDQITYQRKYEQFMTLLKVPYNQQSEEAKRSDPTHSDAAEATLTDSNDAGEIEANTEKKQADDEYKTQMTDTAADCLTIKRWLMFNGRRTGEFAAILEKIEHNGKYFYGPGKDIKTLRNDYEAMIQAQHDVSPFIENIVNALAEPAPSPTLSR